MKIFAKTDVGKKREMNQDFFKIHSFDDNASILIVCDGMGGENAGNIASEMATNSFFNSIKKLYNPDMDFNDIKSMLTFSVNKANLEVFDSAQDNPEYHGMGTTIVAVLLKENYAFVVHAGDSRAYLIREGYAQQITTDHSIVQNMIESNLITPEEAKHHPKRNVITRALGVSEVLETDYKVINTIKNDSIILCSDGLTNFINEENIVDILENNEVEAACDILIDLANSNGGSDNITVAVAKIDE